MAESRRRAEIESKRAKLAELKRAREERDRRIAAGRGEKGSEASTPSARKDLDDLVATLVGTSASASGGRSGSSSAVGRMPSYSTAGGEPSSDGATGAGLAVNSDSPGRGGRLSTGPGASSEYGSEAMGREDGAEGLYARTPQLISGAQELFEYPQKERVYYTKEVQTTSTSTDDDMGENGFVGEGAGGAGGEARIPAAAEAALRAKIKKELEEAQEAKEAEEMKLEEERLEREIEEGLRELSSAELNSIYGAQDFTSFVQTSSKIVERALTDAYDFMKDYTKDESGAGDEAEARQVKVVRTFWDDKLCRGRSVTDLDWSARHPELSVASYSRSDAISNEDPDGVVAVWNMHLADRPEFVFHAQTDVLSTKFSPFNPNLVVGGTYSGQILIWDTRSGTLPVLKTPLSAAGHTHPVYSLQIVGTQNAHNLVSASTDGLVCGWMMDVLAKPSEVLELLSPHHTKTDEVSVTSFGFPDQETVEFLVGTEEGHIFPCARFDRASGKAGLNASYVLKGHAAPVSSLHFHPLYGPVDFSDLFLSSSMDWTSRLWRLPGQSAAAAGGAPTAPGVSSLGSAAASFASAGISGASSYNTSVVEPVTTFEEAPEYVYDVRWHPTHPAVFGQVDGVGRFDLFNLNEDTERPISSTIIGNGRALNKLAWDKKEGKKAAMGGIDGRVYIADVGTLAQPREDEWMTFQRTVADLLNPDKQRGIPETLPASAADRPHHSDANET
ncbi:Cytoplasmic dynein intermediate chain [Ceraceosorus bombacis]|uniref:Cytoplasmic dynein intermediate chain n=1 Tax=Ceraceosorus bombacis TaxID=401625 RepID=A0A0P1BI87_9BASI|nr:Cytoplasmic dynein intermediate chain [Ceraceosorus bombacis]